MKSIKTYVATSAILILSISSIISPAFGWGSSEDQDKAESATTASAGVAKPDYRLNPGDILAISVWREADLQREVLVRPDGKFSFPLAGDIEARGNTVEEISALLTEKLARYIPDLVVSVSVLAINGNKVYVIGQVNRPGEINANPQVDIMQALSIAGGTTPYAQVNDISILRRTESGLESIPFRYGDIEKGKRLDQNIILQAGDVIVVP